MPPTDSPPTYYALITGYGPFSGVTNNPSWSCTKPLHNKVIQTQSGAKVHISVLGPIRVTYEAVLNLIPRIHARPPRLPLSAEAAESILDFDTISSESFKAPPHYGYDLVLHVGAGLNGSARLEQVGHKCGYWAPDVNENYATLIASRESLSNGVSEAESFERDRLDSNVKMTKGQLRGFADGYEAFPEELKTEVDVEAVIAGLNRSGETRIQPSVDAGHYLCDFLCYGSLAESQRPLFESKNANIKRSKTLFMHVPTAAQQPFTRDELVELVKQVVAQVCTGEKAI